MIICFNFLRNENYVNKISSRSSTLETILIKIYLESFVFSSHFSISLDSSTKVIFAISVSYWATSSSAKPSILGTTLSENAFWVPGLAS